MKFLHKLRHPMGSGTGVVTVQSDTAGLNQALSDIRIQPTLVVGFVSPHVDIDRIATTVRNRFPNAAITLCDYFKCDADTLEQKLAEYSFAIRTGGELYVRSVFHIDTAQHRIHFYCDIAPGDELQLVRRTGLVETTRRDLQRFMQHTRETAEHTRRVADSLQALVVKA